MTNQQTNLIQHKGNFQLRGIITGKDPETARKGNGYKEGKIEKGINAGNPYRAIRFLVKTSPDNIIPVELFGQPRKQAVWYSRKEKKSIKIDWAKRFNQPPDGYELILPEYDLVKKIDDDFKDGDSVFINGEFRFSTYKDQQGNVRPQTQYIIRSIYHTTNPVDFESENFKEQNTFEQEIVIQDIMEDSKVKKLFVSAYVIGYGGTFNPAMFEINTETADATFIRNMKSLKFGDQIKVNGYIHNRALTEEVCDNDGWGQKVKSVTNYYRALEIVGAFGDTLQKKLYKEEDFIVNDSTSTMEGTSQEAQKLSEIINDSNEELPFDLD